MHGPRCPRVRAPSRQPALLAKDVAFALAAWGLLLAHAGATTWLTWLVGFVTVRAGGLADSLWADTESPFLRQFLPFDTLRLVVADGVPAWLLLWSWPTGSGLSIECPGQ